MEAAPTDAEAMEIAKRELKNGDFGDPAGWSADCIFNCGKGAAEGAGYNWLVATDRAVITLL